MRDPKDSVALEVAIKPREGTARDRQQVGMPLTQAGPTYCVLALSDFDRPTIWP
jgi:hypothetical protein